MGKGRGRHKLRLGLHPKLLIIVLAHNHIYKTKTRTKKTEKSQTKPPDQTHTSFALDENGGSIYKALSIPNQIAPVALTTSAEVHADHFYAKKESPYSPQKIVKSLQ